MTAPQPQPASGRPATDVVVDGHRATLVEISPTRLLVYSQHPVKPEQKVRVVLRSEGTVLRLRAQVSSAKFEMPQEGSRYRVELMLEGDTTGIEQFIE